MEPKPLAQSILEEYMLKTRYPLNQHPKQQNIGNFIFAFEIPTGDNSIIAFYTKHGTLEAGLPQQRPIEDCLAVIGKEDLDQISQGLLSGTDNSWKLHIFKIQKDQLVLHQTLNHDSVHTHNFH